MLTGYRSPLVMSNVRLTVCMVTRGEDDYLSMSGSGGGEWCHSSHVGRQDRTDRNLELSTGHTGPATTESAHSLSCTSHSQSGVQGTNTVMYDRVSSDGINMNKMILYN